MITRKVNQETGIIYVTSIGTPTRAAIEHHYVALRALIDPIRSARRRVLLLSDIRASARTTTEIEQQILNEMARTYRPGDRVVLLTSEEDRNHVREVLGGVAISVFRSQLAAEMWLVSDDLPRIA